MGNVNASSPGSSSCAEALLTPHGEREPGDPNQADVWTSLLLTPHGEREQPKVAMEDINGRCS